MATKYRMTRYHVIDTADGTKLGDFGLLTVAEERANALNFAEATTRRYQVHRVELNERGRVVERAWVTAPDARES